MKDNSATIPMGKITAAAEGSGWCVYMILSSDDRIYTGITNNIVKRWRAHSGGPQGAKFFRGRRPKKLVYLETQESRSSASKREAAVKKLTRLDKLQLIQAQTIDWHQHLALPIQDDEV